LLGEPEAPTVARILDRVRAGKDELLLPFIMLMEVRYRLLRDYPRDAGAGVAIVQSWRGRVVESHPAWGAAAAEVKAGGGLSLADAWIASLALMQDATLVHKDAEFERVPELRSVHLGR
jgi:predicted nucleic acid-binding protein